MAEAHGYLKHLLGNLRALRERAGISANTLEERLILGPGWVSRFEIGDSVPSLDMVLAILHQTGAGLEQLLDGLPEPGAAEVARCVVAEQSGKNVIINFRYADFDAKYTLPNSKLADFEVVIKTLRDGLARLANTDAQSIKTDSVARTFLVAAKCWPKANPSDLWWFLVYRAYCDPYNHPAQYARLDFTQAGSGQD